MANEYYSTLYSMNFRIIVDKFKTITISPGDVVSLTISNDYDRSTYPIIRLRIYSDLSVIQNIAEYPDALELRASVTGGIYQMSTDQTPRLIKPTKGFDFSAKIYLEYKNIPTSPMDQYQNGLPRSMNEDLNTENKVPIELYCYDDTTIHRMKDQPPAIYKDMSLVTVVSRMFDYCNIPKYVIEPFTNSKKYDQILIPNLNMIDSLSYFDKTYGMYPKGAGIYEDLYGFDNRIVIYNLDTKNFISSRVNTFPIYVNSYSNDSDMGGMKKIQDVSSGNSDYYLETKYDNVSVMTESDIAKVLNAEYLESVNINTLKVSFHKVFDDLQNYTFNRSRETYISPDYILHKYLSEYVTETVIARLNEQVTRIDVSGVGFNVEYFNPMSRFNLIFESPIRGINMADIYRPIFINNVFNSIGNDLFIASTTMRLCKN